MPIECGNDAGDATRTEQVSPVGFDGPVGDCLTSVAGGHPAPPRRFASKVADGSSVPLVPLVPGSEESVFVERSGRR